MYYLVKRQAEVEILPMTKSEHGRLIDEPRYGSDEDLVVADKFVNYAQARNVKSATLAVARIMANPDVTALIISARNLRQLEGSLAAIDFKMTSEMYAIISGLSRMPASATDPTGVLSGKWK